MCKSHVTAPPCKTVRFLRILIVLKTFILVSHQETYNYRVMEIVDDLPVEGDLDKYISALKKIVRFVDSHRYYVDIDLCLGVYLINGHLRSIMQSKANILSYERKDRIVNLMKINDKIIYHFIKISRTQQDKQEVPEVLVTMLNMNGKQVKWPYQTPKFNTDLLNSTRFYSRKKLDLIYFKWHKYKKTVYDYKTGYSSPDSCMSLLAQNPINNLTTFVYCQVPYNCVEYVTNGLDYGYEIAHRLLFLFMARYWRNCIITANDKEIIDGFCTKMYNELEYIASHNFELPDLFIDHVMLCSFEGHAQFLRRSWIEELLEFQTRFGCFNLTRPNAESALLVAIFENISEKGDLMVWEGSCNAHITGAAGVMLAAAIRFILNTS